MEQYPAVQFMVKYGPRMSYLVAVAPVLIVALGAWFEGWGPVWWVTGGLAGAVLGFAFRTFAELTQIIADMLLPQ